MKVYSKVNSSIFDIFLMLCQRKRLMLAFEILFTYSFCFWNGSHANPSIVW